MVLDVFYISSVIQTSKETVILRNQSKTCIYVRVEVDLKTSWRSLGGALEGVWRRRGASGRALGASHRRLEKQTRPNRLNRPRKSAATQRKSVGTQLPSSRSRGSRSIYLARHMIRSSLSICRTIYLSDIDRN